MTLAFSAAAAAAIKLLFSASDKRGDRNKNAGSMQVDENPYESLKNVVFFTYFNRKRTILLC
jgi:hypothetical protein